MVQFRDGKGVVISNDPEKNSVKIRGERFYLDYIDEKKRGSGKGSHSSVYIALDDTARDRSFVVKFCNYPVRVEGKNVLALDPYYQPLVDRFRGEITALRLVKESKWASKAIQLLDAGLMELDLSGSNRGEKSVVLWLATELADSDLAEFLKKNSIEVEQRVVICFDILQSLNGLHSLGIIHRDIKPDNVVFVNGAWKFLDLGIADVPGRNIAIDGFFEKIGPFGYMSPEALNKCMGVRSHPSFAASCDIDELSDVFQLGMMFWFVLRGEVPAGLIDKSDLDDLSLDADFFERGLSKMLSIRKARRPNCSNLMGELEAFFSHYGLKG